MTYGICDVAMQMALFASMHSEGTHLMDRVNKRSWWPFVAGIGLAAAISSTGRPNERPERDLPGAMQPVDWIRGVPSGCRLVSFDLTDRDSERLDRRDRVHVVWKYASAADCYDTTVLMEDVHVLHTEGQGDQGSFHVMVALTPLQADRLRVAAACGSLEIRQASKETLRSGESVPTWNVHGIEDRTQAIEACLSACSEDPKSLERPTLAVQTGDFFNGPRDVITVPVRLEFQR